MSSTRQESDRQDQDFDVSAITGVMAAVVLLLAVVGQLPQGFYKYPPSQMVLWVSGALLIGIFIGLQARSRSGENRRSESETPAAAESYNP